MWQQEKKKSGFLLLKWKRVVCLVKKHKPITVIEKMEIEESYQDVWGVSVRGRITATSKKCERCRKRLS